MPAKITVQNENEPIRVILDKTRAEKIGSFLWSAIKVIFVVFFLFSLFATASLVPPAGGIQKTYFDRYFATTGEDPTAQKIAVIPISGEIIDSSSATPLAGLQGVNADDIIFLLSEALYDDNISAVLLRIDSPGGTALAAAKISTIIKEISEKKPVFALLEGTAASGGYYIASVTKKIYAYSGTLTGSIGVIVQIPKVQELLNKIGVEMRTITTGKLKDIGSVFRDMTPEEQQIFQNLLAETYDEFIDTVAAGRNMTPEKVRELADGQIYSGKQAQKNGLVDAIVTSFGETLDNIQTEMGVEKIQPVLFAIPVSPWEQFLLGVRAKSISLSDVTQVAENGLRLWMK